MSEAPLGAKIDRRECAAPTELFDHWPLSSYKHVAPMELRQLASHRIVLTFSSKYLPCGLPHESRIEDKISPPEAFGFLGEPIEPFEAEAAEPGRGFFYIAGVKIERRADTEHDTF